MSRFETVQEKTAGIEADVISPDGFRKRFPKPHFRGSRIYSPEKSELPEANIEPRSNETRGTLSR